MEAYKTYGFFLIKITIFTCVTSGYSLHGYTMVQGDNNLLSKSVCNYFSKHPHSSLVLITNIVNLSFRNHKLAERQILSRLNPYIKIFR